MGVSNVYTIMMVTAEAAGAKSNDFREAVSPCPDDAHADRRYGQLLSPNQLILRYFFSATGAITPTRGGGLERMTHGLPITSA